MIEYAKQADDPALHDFATRITARAIRRAGELLQTFQSPGARTDQPTADVGPRSQLEAGTDARMSERQIKTAVRVANVPADDFEAAVDGEHPPTTRAATRGDDDDLIAWRTQRSPSYSPRRCTRLGCDTPPSLARGDGVPRATASEGDERGGDTVQEPSPATTQDCRRGSPSLAAIDSRHTRRHGRR